MSREEDIKQEAKKIMDEFVKALEKVDVGERIGFDSDEDVRTPKKGKADSDFKKKILDNAPAKKDGCTLAEKKKW